MLQSLIPLTKLQSLILFLDSQFSLKLNAISTGTVQFLPFPLGPYLLLGFRPTNTPVFLAAIHEYLATEGDINDHESTVKAIKGVFV
ncbi:hypothetical protein P8452_42718 [Trifolium repens]|nr:hypothetical protein P8452_42718 [Trifolium repens]